MTSLTIGDPLCTRCGHRRSLHRRVERPDIWWCEGNGTGPGRCTCPVFTDYVAPEPEPEPALDDDGTPFETSFVAVQRGQSIIWSKSSLDKIRVPAQFVEHSQYTTGNNPKGFLTTESTAEIRDFRLDCVIDDGALSGRRAAWIAILAGLSLGPAPRVTFAERQYCDTCGVHLAGTVRTQDDDDIEGDRLFSAFDTLYKGDVGLLVRPYTPFFLDIMFDRAALKPDEQIPIGFLRVVMSGMLYDDGDE